MGLVGQGYAAARAGSGQKLTATAAAEELAALMKRTLNVDVEPNIIKDALDMHWSKFSLLAHAVHNGVRPG